MLRVDLSPWLMQCGILAVIGVASLAGCEAPSSAMNAPPDTGYPPGSEDQGTTTPGQVVAPLADAGVDPGGPLSDASAGADALAPEDAASPPVLADLHTCEGGERPDPRDAQLTGEPERWVSPTSGAVDLVLPRAVLDWMTERVWQASHDAWHNIRRCGGGGPGAFGGFDGFGGFGDFGGGSGIDICEYTEMIPENRECENARDGYEFLVMHRHMIESLQQAFPDNAQLFEGFPSFPFEAQEVPEAWRDRFGNGWSSSILDTARVLEDIENQLDRFPSEGDLGQYIQCGGMASGVSSIHGALHFKWVVNDSPHSLGSQPVNLENYMFWKLHGWIDSIWERYRLAKGLSADPNDALDDELAAQCWEMHDLGHVIDPSFDAEGRDEPLVDGEPLPDESGTFHDAVRPILEKHCAGCHGVRSPSGNLTLGGDASSADIAASLVGGPTRGGGQFQLVTPFAPEQSWLYLKASGTAAGAGCQGVLCNAQVMPPAGEVTLSDAELATLYQWIADGAQLPSP